MLKKALERTEKEAIKPLLSPSRVSQVVPAKDRGVQQQKRKSTTALDEEVDSKGQAALGRASKNTTTTSSFPSSGNDDANNSKISPPVVSTTPPLPAAIFPSSGNWQNALRYFEAQVLSGSPITAELSARVSALFANTAPTRPGTDLTFPSISPSSSSLGQDPFASLSKGSSSSSGRTETSSTTGMSPPPPIPSDYHKTQMLQAIAEKKKMKGPGDDKVRETDGDLFLPLQVEARSHRQQEVVAGALSPMEDSTAPILGDAHHESQSGEIVTSSSSAVNSQENGEGSDLSSSCQEGEEGEKDQEVADQLRKWWYLFRSEGVPLSSVELYALLRHGLVRQALASATAPGPLLQPPSPSSLPTAGESSTSTLASTTFGYNHQLMGEIVSFYSRGGDWKLALELMSLAPKVVGPTASYRKELLAGRFERQKDYATSSALTEAFAEHQLSKRILPRSIQKKLRAEKAKEEEPISLAEAVLDPEKAEKVKSFVLPDKKEKERKKKERDLATADPFSFLPAQLAATIRANRTQHQWAAASLVYHLYSPQISPSSSSCSPSTASTTTQPSESVEREVTHVTQPKEKLTDESNDAVLPQQQQHSSVMALIEQEELPYMVAKLAPRLEDPAAFNLLRIYLTLAAELELRQRETSKDHSKKKIPRPDREISSFAPSPPVVEGRRKGTAWALALGVVARHLEWRRTELWDREGGRITNPRVISGKTTVDTPKGAYRHQQQKLHQKATPDILNTLLRFIITVRKPFLGSSLALEIVRLHGPRAVSRQSLRDLVDAALSHTRQRSDQLQRHDDDRSSSSNSLSNREEEQHGFHSISFREVVVACAEYDDVQVGKRAAATAAATSKSSSFASFVSGNDAPSTSSGSRVGEESSSHRHSSYVVVEDCDSHQDHQWLPEQKRLALARVWEGYGDWERALRLGGLEYALRTSGERTRSLRNKEGGGRTIATATPVSETSSNDVSSSSSSSQSTTEGASPSSFDQYEDDIAGLIRREGPLSKEVVDSIQSSASSDAEEQVVMSGRTSGGGGDKLKVMASGIQVAFGKGDVAAAAKLSNAILEEHFKGKKHEGDRDSSATDSKKNGSVLDTLTVVQLDAFISTSVTTGKWQNALSAIQLMISHSTAFAEDEQKAQRRRMLEDKVAAARRTKYLKTWERHVLRRYEKLLKAEQKKDLEAGGVEKKAEQREYSVLDTAILAAIRSQSQRVVAQRGEKSNKKPQQRHGDQQSSPTLNWQEALGLYFTSSAKK